MADDFYSDIVTLKSRTSEKLGVMHDSRLREIHPKKGLKVPRDIAELGKIQHALRWSATHGGVLDSKVYIEDDIGTALETPHKPLEEDEVKKMKQTDGLGKDKIMVDGKLINKTTINLDPGGDDKENFMSNNL